MIEGQIPASRKRENLTNIGVTRGPERIVVIVGDIGVSLAETGHVVDLVRPGVAEREEGASPGAHRPLAAQFNHRTVIIGSRNVLELRDVAEHRVRVWRIVDSRVGPEGERVYIDESR